MYIVREWWKYNFNVKVPLCQFYGFCHAIDNFQILGAQNQEGGFVSGKEKKIGVEEGGMTAIKESSPFDGLGDFTLWQQLVKHLLTREGQLKP